MWTSAFLMMFPVFAVVALVAGVAIEIWQVLKDKKHESELDNDK